MFWRRYTRPMSEASTSTAAKIDPASAREWRRWLETNHASSKGVWVLVAKKGAPGLTYEAALDEALRYGWIDSRAHAGDAKTFSIWFSPRKPSGIWATSNKTRVERLITACRMEPAGLAAIATAKANGSWSALEDIDNLVIPADFQAALDDHPAAAANFAAFSDSKKKMILRWFDSAKRPETRARRVAETIDHATRNELPHH
jgi:uncharacterized protein YdeI (YjbR/CyaY-like superfamily)